MLYFYPKDDTSGCTTEAIDFSAKLAEFEAAGAVVIGVSKDSVRSHDKFRDKHGLGLILLVGRGRRRDRAVRRLGRKVDVRQEIHGDRPLDLPDRRATAASRASGARSRCRAMSRRCSPRPRRSEPPRAAPRSVSRYPPTPASCGPKAGPRRLPSPAAFLRVPPWLRERARSSERPEGGGMVGRRRGLRGAFAAALPGEASFHPHARTAPATCA